MVVDTEIAILDTAADTEQSTSCYCHYFIPCTLYIPLPKTQKQCWDRELPPTRLALARVPHFGRHRLPLVRSTVSTPTYSVAEPFLFALPEQPFVSLTVIPLSTVYFEHIQKMQEHCEYPAES